VSPEYWAARYAMLQQDLHSVQLHMEALAADVAAALTAVRREGGDASGAASAIPL